MRLKHICFQLVLTWVGLSSTYAWGFDWRQLNFAELSDEIQHDLQRFDGTWKDSAAWKGSLCGGSYYYEVYGRADAEKIDFQLNEKGSVNVNGLFKNLFAKARGRYQGDYTLCVPMKGNYEAAIDDAEIDAEATFEGAGESLKDLKVKVLRTKLGRIRLAQWLPDWFENFLTRQINRGLSQVWASRLGEWLSDKITEIIKKKIPDSKLEGKN